MKKYIIHQNGAGALAAAGHTAQQIHPVRKPGEGAAHAAGAAHTAGAEGAGRGGGAGRAVIKLGLDIHARLYVVVAQHGHGTPKPARRFEPGEFAPWVESLRRAGHEVHVVYEACGFGFGLCRRLWEMGAHCDVIAPRKLDEARTGVKTDPRDALTLCQRLCRRPPAPPFGQRLRPLAISLRSIRAGWRAMRTNWPSSGCPARRRKGRATFAGSASSSCGTGRNSRRRGAGY